MKDVSAKFNTLRYATAEACVNASAQAIAAAKSGNTPKGAVWDIARAAGIIAAKRTPELIPYCHSIALDHVSIDFEITQSSVKIIAKAKAIAKTGVEMEALTAATIASLTVYDMLKPIDADVTIAGIRLIEKKGGKSDFRELKKPTAAVLITSDSVASGEKDDSSGKSIADRLKKIGADVKACIAIPDDAEKIAKVIKAWTSEGIELIVTTGGTGLGPRDVTVDALSKMIDREVPGIAEAIRAYGQKRTPYAMLSRGISGMIGKTLVISLPGSLKGATESMDAILPHIFHIYPMLEGKGH